VGHEEAVDHVEVLRVAPVQAHHAAALDDELGRGVVRPVGRDETELRQRRDEQLATELPLGA
jgi:hypothetical protein